MRKFVILAALSAVVLPATAHAQNREIRRDRAELREQQRDLRDAQRYGDRRDVREARRDVRDARRDLRQSQRNWQRDDWRSYRQANRNLYRGGRWESPYRYRTFAPGAQIGAGYYGQRFAINDPWRYRLPRPGPNLQYVRFYNDVLLVNVRTGRVVRVMRNFYW